MDQDLLLKEVQALRVARLRLETHRASVARRVRRMERARLHGAEAFTLDGLARRERERPQRAAVEATEERDHPVALG